MTMTSWLLHQWLNWSFYLSTWSSPSGFDGAIKWTFCVSHSSVPSLHAAAVLLSIDSSLSYHKPGPFFSPPHLLPSFPFSLLLLISLCVQQSTEQAAGNVKPGQSRTARTSRSLLPFTPNVPNQVLIDLGLEHQGPPLSPWSSLLIFHFSSFFSSTYICLHCMSARCIFSWWVLISLPDPIAVIGRFFYTCIHPRKDFASADYAHACSEMSRFAFFTVIHIHSWELPSTTTLF